MNLDQAVNIEDLHRMAKRRLPKIAFDFIEGGLEDERGLSSATPPRFISTGCCRGISLTCPGVTNRRRCSVGLIRARSAFRQPVRPGCSARAPI
jgi:hypothetical protein